MNGMLPEKADGRAADVQKLEESFRLFTQVTRGLEQAYRRLENRTGNVDERFRDANRRLVARVAELKAANAELNGILDAIPCGVVTCDGAGVITRMNPAAERILGRPSLELVGRDVRTLRDHDGRPLLLTGREEVRHGITADRLVGCLDGALRFLSGSVAGLEDGGTLEIISDQTEVAHLRAQINRLDTLAALGEMAASVAHEIRNPMNGVEGFAGLLERSLRNGDEVPPAQLRRYTDRIRQGVAEVNAIITNLLLWARPERTKPQAVRIVELFEEVRRDANEGPNATSLAALEIVPPFELLEVAADRVKLKLALGNLVRNALEAAGPRGQVRVSSEADGRKLRILVDDDGPGVAPEIKGRLFRPFTTTKPQGCGLGLALTRKLVELHGGEVGSGRSPLGGARFMLTLPLSGSGWDAQ